MDLLQGNKSNLTPTREASAKIKILGNLKNIAKLRKEIHKLSIFNEVRWENGVLSCLIVESADKDKTPHLFIRFSFKQDSASAEYSIPPEVVHPDARRLHVVKTLFTLLSLLEERGAFISRRDDFYNKTMEALELSAEFFGIDPLQMKFELDHYAKDNGFMKTELSSLKLENEGLNHQLLELDKKCNLLEDRVRQLEGMTDNELDREIIRWIGEHGGKIDDEGFCSAMNIRCQRLDERLDSLSKRGVIRIV